MKVRRCVGAAVIAASVAGLLTGCFQQAVEIQQSLGVMREVYKVPLDGYSLGELQAGVAGIDYVNPNAHFEATANDAAIKPAEHCKNALAYAAKLGADEWMNDPDYVATKVSVSPGQALAHCAQALLRGTTFQMQGFYKDTPIRLELSPNSVGVSSAMGENWALEHREFDPGRLEQLGFLDAVAKARLDNPAIDPLSPKLMQQVIDSYKVATVFTPVVDADGLVRRVSVKPATDMLVETCVSVLPWDEALMGVPDPGPPGYGFGYVDSLDQLKSFGQAATVPCEAK